MFFISYRRIKRDRKFATELKHKIEDELGDTVWMDTRITTGDNWRDVIDRALQECIAVLLIATPDALQSDYVKYEWAHAIGVGNIVMPIFLDDPDTIRKDETLFHPRLEPLQYMDFSKSYDWEMLFRDLKRIIEESYIPPEIVNDGIALRGHDKGKTTST